MEAILARAVQFLLALGGAYLVTLWFALVVWTFQDIQRRSRSVIAQIFSTLVVVLFMVPGVLIYLLLRPRDTLDETFQRSLEEEYLLQDLEELPLCPNCQRYVQDEFTFCPHCRTELRQACVSCERMIDLRWDVCPYCGTEQYPEEPAVAAIDEWPRGEPRSVREIVSGTRERLANRWMRLPPGEDGDAARTAAVGMSDPSRRREHAWDEDEPDAGAWGRRGGAESNGAHDTWEEAPESRPASFDRTDELPAGAVPPQR